MPSRLTLRLEVHASATVHYSTDNWATCHDVKTIDTQLGLHIADLPTDRLKDGSQILFTFHWTTTDKWEGKNFAVRIES